MFFKSSFNNLIQLSRSRCFNREPGLSDCCWCDIDGWSSPFFISSCWTQRIAIPKPIWYTIRFRTSHPQHRWWNSNVHRMRFTRWHPLSSLVERALLHYHSKLSQSWRYNPLKRFMSKDLTNIICLQSVWRWFRADRSSVTFVGAFVTAKATFKFTEKTTIYAVFFSGLQKVSDSC